MARTNPLRSLCFLLLTVIALAAAHPLGHPRLYRKPLHTETYHGIHRRSDTTKEQLSGKESLYSRYATTFALPITALEQLRSDTMLSIKARQGPTGSSVHDIELPFSLEELQDKLEAFMQSLSDDLAALFNYDSSSASPSATTSPPTIGVTTAPTSRITASWAVLPSFSTAQASPLGLSTALLTAQSTLTSTLAIYPPTSTSSVLVTSTPSMTPANRSHPYVFNPMANNNVVVYYGQTTQTSAVPLTQVCADPNVDLVILAFVPTFFGPGGWPTLNMGPHCWAASTAQSQAGATGLIDCVSDGFANQVRQCQDAGKKVLLSLGGAQGYSDTTIPSDQDAEMLASKLWNLFLGGMEIPQTNAIRPFGDVVLDGIDVGKKHALAGLWTLNPVLPVPANFHSIDNESGTTAYFATLISALRALFQSSAATKPYFLSAAPQCPRPDASIPLSSMQTSLDFVWVQFYNNPSCNLASGTSFLNSLAAWSGDLAADTADFINTGNGVSSPRLYMGVPAWPGAGSGYVDANGLRSLLQSVHGAHANFGGVMFWDGAFGEESAGSDGSSETLMQVVKDVLG
jgi:chitinase